MVEQRSVKECYLPQHPVINPKKQGNMRWVLNGAAKFIGASLNMSLVAGTDLIQVLIHVLLRFRAQQFEAFADIQSMLLQVGIPECRQPSLWFLWREEPTTNQNTPRIFSAKDKPTCANYTLQRTARDNRSQNRSKQSFTR